MAYSVQADVQKAAGGAEQLLQLTDIENSGSVDTDALDAAIAEADAWINSYAQRRHDVPFEAPVPTIIVQLSAEETVYRLKMRRNSLSETDKERHLERLDWLKDLSMGRVSPGVDPVPDSSTNVAPEILERSSDEDISRDSLDGFS